MKRRGRYGTTNAQDLRAIAELHRIIRNYMKMQKLIEKSDNGKDNLHNIEARAGSCNL